MKVIIFGATGMVGRGVLRECLQAADVEKVLAICRKATGLRDARLQEVIQPDLTDYRSIDDELRGYDACFLCLGVSSSGMDEAAYTRATYDLTLAIATPLAERIPGLTIVYISGAGTDAGSKTMWARVKGETEAALQALPHAKVYSLRPGVILPMNGERSGVAAYRVFYKVAGPLLRLIRHLAPQSLLTTELIGLAMLALARHGGRQPILEAKDIYRTVNPKE